MLLDNPLIVTPSVKHIVVVGDDTVLPFGRILDNTSYANERGYASTFFGTSNNQYLSTYALGLLPTDDPLADVNYAGQGPYVPELALGRLVETPAQIISQVDQYVTRNGAIAPTRALTTGYDFLKDGSTQISTRLKAKVGAANATELINDTWSKTDLLGAMFPAANAPQIVSLNAHYDHFRSLPADENAAHRETILFTTADLLTRSTSGRVVFTMGCHSALPVSDFVVGDVLKPDWAQAYAQTGAVVYMGNTGFGLGDTAAVLYSEKLNVLFAERLDGSMTVGQALAFAKQEYAATPTLSGYHLKVIDQASMMGLPMYRVGTATGPTPPNPAITSTDSATGLPTASFSVSPTFTRVDTPSGSYYASDDSFAENRRPIEPTTKRDITQPGLVAHGALITGLTSVDETGFDAAFSRVVDDLSAFSPELVGDVTFPTKLQSIATVATPTGTRQRLGLFTGQFRSDGIPEALGIGTQRRFTSLSGNVLYALPTATDFTPSTFGPVEVTQAASTVGFAVDVEDNAGGAAGVKRVFALYRDESGSWRTSRDVAQLVPVEWRRPTRRHHGRVVHPGGRRHRQRRRDEQQGRGSLRDARGADRRHRGRADRPAGQRLVHGRRRGHDQRSPRNQLQPRRSPVHAGHVADGHRNRHPFARLPGERRLSRLGRCADRRLAPDRDRERLVRLRADCPRVLCRLGLGHRLVQRARSARHELGGAEDDQRSRRGSGGHVFEGSITYHGAAESVHRFLLARRQPADRQRHQRREQRAGQVQPRRLPGPRRARDGLPGFAADDLRGDRPGRPRGDLAPRRERLQLRPGDGSLQVRLEDATAPGRARADSSSSASATARRSAPTSASGSA